MPAGRIDQTLYIGPSTTIESMNTTTLYKPGELGSQIQTTTGKAYQLIQLDSGATAATAAGAPVAGQLAFWKSKLAYIVTNDRAQAIYPGTTNSRQAIAGVFCATTVNGAAGSATLTPGNYGVIQQRGAHVGVYTNANSVTAGQNLVADIASTAQAVAVAIGTAPGVPPVGIATAANGAVTANYTPATLGGWDLVDVP